MAHKRIDLNADVGEGLPAEQERALLEVVTSTSIACGFHAGDAAHHAADAGAWPGSLASGLGAHPSYPDRDNFGRVSMPMRPESLIDCIGEQVSMLQEAALETGMRIAYLKPHGALYNDAAVDEAVARSVATAAALLGLPMMLLAGSPTASPAARGLAAGDRRGIYRPRLPG